MLHHKRSNLQISTLTVQLLLAAFWKKALTWILIMPKGIGTAGPNSASYPF